MRPLPAAPALLLTAAVTALLAGAGGAVAGSLVTSAQIQDGTIRSVDVADGTLNLRDMRPGAREGMAGEDGATGAAGAAGTDGVDGVDGAPGPRGLVGATGLPGPAGAPGPQGLPGLAGVDGAAGADGADGADGLIGYQVVEGTPVLATLLDPVNGVYSKVAQAACPTGKTAISGGSYLFGALGGVPLGTSVTWDMANFTGTGWMVQSAGPVPHYVQAIAYCVTG